MVYTGPIKTEVIAQADKSVSISIETDRLYLISVTEDDIFYYEDFFSKEEIYKRYGTGRKLAPGRWARYVRNTYLKERLGQGNPLGGLIIWKKEEQSMP